MKYNEKTTIAFLKALEASKVITKGSHKNDEVVECVNEIINMSEEAVSKESATAQMFFHEFTDWIETYQITAK